MDERRDKSSRDDSQRRVVYLAPGRGEGGHRRYNRSDCSLRQSVTEVSLATMW